MSEEQPKICPNCQRRNLHDALICGYCRHDISDILPLEPVEPGCLSLIFGRLLQRGTSCAGCLYANLVFIFWLTVLCSTFFICAASSYGMQHYEDDTTIQCLLRRPQLYMWNGYWQDFNPENRGLKSDEYLGLQRGGYRTRRISYCFR